MELVVAADIDECSQQEDRVSRLCHGLCRNVEGSFVCSCPVGYRMAPDDRTCQGWSPSLYSHDFKKIFNGFKDKKSSANAKGIAQQQCTVVR